jgi:hypothetical protein
MLNVENVFNSIALERWDNAREGWKEEHVENVLWTLEADALPYFCVYYFNTSGVLVI